MKLFSLASIPTKAAAAGVLGLAALGGTGTALVLQPANDTRPPAAAEVDETTTSIVEDETATTDTEVPATTEKVTTDGEDGEDGEATAAKDNFGAIVSADARDGGVDGQEISAEAHARNEARKAQRSTPPGTDDADDESDDDAEDEADADTDDDAEDEADDDTDDDAEDDTDDDARTPGKAEGRKG